MVSSSNPPEGAIVALMNTLSSSLSISHILNFSFIFYKVYRLFILSCELTSCFLARDLISTLFLFKISHYANTHREVTFEGDIRIIFACSTDLEIIIFFLITSKKHLVVILIFQNVFLKGSSRSQITTSGVAKDKKITLYYHYYYNIGVFFLSWTKKKKRRTKKDQTVSSTCTKLCSLIHTRHLNMPHF